MGHASSHRSRMRTAEPARMQPWLGGATTHCTIHPQCHCPLHRATHLRPGCPFTTAHATQHASATQRQLPLLGPPSGLEWPRVAFSPGPAVVLSIALLALGIGAVARSGRSSSFSISCVMDVPLTTQSTTGNRRERHPRVQDLKDRASLVESSGPSSTTSPAMMCLSRVSTCVQSRSLPNRPGRTPNGMGELARWTLKSAVTVHSAAEADWSFRPEHHCQASGVLIEYLATSPQDFHPPET